MDRALSREFFRFNLCSQPKVNDFNDFFIGVGLCGEQSILRFDVPVDDPSVVAVHQCGKDLIQIQSSFLFLHRSAPLHMARQGLRLAEFSHNVDEVGIHEVLVHF